MANQYINALTALWNSAGTTYAAIKMNVTNAASAVDSKLFQLQVGSVDKFVVDKNGGIVSAGTITATGMVTSAPSLPASNDGAALGSSIKAWSDLYLASGGVINWNAGDVVITHLTDNVTFSGAANGYWFDQTLRPVLNDVGALGVNGTAWSDLFLATGAVINFAGEIPATITHTPAVPAIPANPGILTVHADFRSDVTGTNTNSMVAIGQTQTVINKTLNNCPIGEATPTTGKFTTISATGKITVAQDFESSTALATLGTNGAGTIALRPNGVASGVGQTTVDSVGNMSLAGALSLVGNCTVSGSYIANAGYFIGPTTHAVVGTAAGSTTGIVYLRPLGYNNGSKETRVDSAGTLTVNGNINSAGTVTAASNFDSTSTTFIASATTGGTMYFRPNGPGSTSEQMTLNANGALVMSRPTAVNSYSIYAYGQSESAAVIGYNADSSVYGMLGRHDAGVGKWSFYGNGVGLTTGGWTTSDARMKSEIADCNCADAYAKVRSIGVRAYRKEGAIERSELAFDEMGWLAQDIETVIPEAVLDVGIPEIDTEMRSRIGGDTFKATNDRTMLAHLWAAFQHQAHLIESLEAKIVALEAKQNG